MGFFSTNTTDTKQKKPVTKPLAKTPVASKTPGFWSIAKETVKGIPQAAKEAVQGTGAFRDETKLGIARNTVLGLPKAAKEVLFPTRGYSEKELSDAKPTVKENFFAVPKVFTEIGTSLSPLADMIPGVKKLADKAVNTKAGNFFAKGGQALQEFAKPETVGQAKAMRFADVAGFLPLGSLKSLGTAARTIAASKDATVIAKELKAAGLADDVIPALSRELVDITDEKAVASKLTEALGPKKVVDNQVDNVKPIDETADIFTKNDLERLNRNTYSPVNWNNDYRNTISNLKEDFGFTDEIPTELKADWETFLNKYTESYKKGLEIRGDNISPVVAGPARFNYAKREKLLSREQAAGDVRKYLVENFKKKITSYKTALEKEAFKDPEQLSNLIETQARMKSANKILKTGGDDLKIVEELKKIGFDEAQANSLLKPDYMGRKGFPDYMLTSINGKIKNRQKAISKITDPARVQEVKNSAESAQTVNSSDISKPAPKAPKTTETKGKKEVLNALNTSEPVKEIGDFELGTFGKKAAERKVNQKDRFPEAELDDTVKNIKESYRASNDPTNYRYENTAHIAEMPSGEKRVLYTRINPRGKPEIINWHKISGEKYIDTLKTYGAPGGTRTPNLLVRTESPYPLGNRSDTGSVATMAEDVKPTSSVMTKGISDVDRLMAEGEIRVKQKNGREVYEYKGKDGTFKYAPTDEEAVKRIMKMRAQRALAPKKKPEIVVPPKLSNKMVDIAIRKETIQQDPMNALTKFVNKKTGELPEVTGTGKSLFARKGDDIVDEIYEGRKTSEEARAEVTDFLERKKSLTKQEKEVSKEISDFKKAETERLRKESDIQKKEDAYSLTQINRQLPSKQTNIRTLEEMAEQELGKMDVELFSKYSSPLTIELNATPVKKKIGILDYIRTPIEVLKKIGLERQGRLLIKKQDDYLNELPKNIDKIVAWRKRIGTSPEASERIFKYLDGQMQLLEGEELKVALEMKKWLKEWAERLKLPESQQIKEYITHLFSDQLIQKEFDEDLAKIIADKIPGEVYNPFLEKRLGIAGYKQDVWKALDAYVKRATRKVHMDEALEELEFAASTLEKTQWNYVKRLADNVNMRPGEVEELIDNTVKSIAGYKFGQRPAIRTLGLIRQMVSRGAFALNLGTAFRDLSQGINTYAKLGEKYTALGYIKMFSPAAQKELVEQGILNTGFIQDRLLSSRYQTLQKIDKGLFVFMEASSRINRGAAYLGGKAKALRAGKTEVEAIEYAKDIVSRTQFRFGAVDTPVALNGAIAKTLLQFQSFTVKQTEFLLDMAKNKEFAGLLRYTIAGFTFVATIGQIFGMKPKELLPIFRFDTPPSMQFAWESMKALADAPDKYGQDRDTKQKIEDVLKSGRLFIPASSQAKKTLEGLEANKQGGSYNDAGNLQYETKDTLMAKIQNIAFGKYASPEAQAYFKRLEKSEDAQSKLEPVYEQVQKLRSEGKIEEARGLYDNLSDEEKTIYAKVKESAQREATTEGKKAILPVFQELRAMKAAGKTEEALVIYNALTEEQQKYYQLVKKAHESLEKKKTTQDATTEPERNLAEFLLDYADAFATDPSNAWKAMVTDEKLGKVEGNLVELQRFYGRDYLSDEGSEAYVRGELERMGIPFSQRSQYRLEHIVPVSAGGSNDADNLRLIQKEMHDIFTKFDIALGNAVKNKKLTRKEAAKIAIRYKSGEISQAEALELIK